MATEIKAEIPSIPPHLMPALLHDGDLTLAQELALAKGLAPEGILNDQTRLCRERDMRVISLRMRHNQDRLSGYGWISVVQ